METRLFTQREHLLGICSVFEVGKPWEDRFSKSDAFEGRCTDDDVGQCKASISAAKEAAAALAPETTGTNEDVDFPDDILDIARDRGIPLDDPIRLGFLALELDPLGLMKRSSAVYNRLVDIQKERDAKVALTASTATDTSLAAMELLSPTQRRHRIFSIILTFVPDDRREACLAAIGCAPEDLINHLMAGAGSDPS